jgi:hypothetical protein
MTRKATTMTADDVLRGSPVGRAQDVPAACPYGRGIPVNSGPPRVLVQKL